MCVCGGGGGGGETEGQPTVLVLSFLLAWSHDMTRNSDFDILLVVGV